MSMRGKFSFREPLHRDDDDLYITAGQLQFFLNRPNGEQKFRSGDVEFLVYLQECKMYNIVYDETEKNIEAATIFWNPETESINYEYPTEGTVMKRFDDSGILYDDLYIIEDDEDDDIYGLFQ